jgi:hypothetical protein
MGLYMYQGTYTAESVAAQIKEPHDRVEAVRPALEAMGRHDRGRRLPIRRIRSGHPAGGTG